MNPCMRLDSDGVSGISHGCAAAALVNAFLLASVKRPDRTNTSISKHVEGFHQSEGNPEPRRGMIGRHGLARGTRYVAAVAGLSTSARGHVSRSCLHPLLPLCVGVVVSEVLDAARTVGSSKTTRARLTTWLTSLTWPSNGRQQRRPWVMSIVRRQVSKATSITLRRLLTSRQRSLHPRVRTSRKFSRPSTSNHGWPLLIASSTFLPFSPHDHLALSGHSSPFSAVSVDLFVFKPWALRPRLTTASLHWPGLATLARARYTGQGPLHWPGLATPQL